MSDANFYDVGDLVRLSAVFAVGSTLTNPTTVNVKVKSPDGTVTSATPTNDSTGNYHYDVSLTAAGEWFFRFAGTGAAQAAGEGVIVVREQKVA